MRHPKVDKVDVTPTAAFAGAIARRDLVGIFCAPLGFFDVAPPTAE